MGGSIALGAIAAKLVTDTQVAVSWPSPWLVERFAGLGYKGNFADDNRATVQGADLIVVAVKPWMLEQVLGEIRDQVTQRQIVASVVASAGATFDRIEGLLRLDGRKMPPLMRIIPNTAIALGESATFISARGVPEARLREVVGLFDSMGRTFLIEEAQMTAVTALSSCGIAYAFKYIDAAAKGGVELGLDPAQSLDMVLQTVRGALAMLTANHSRPQTEIDKVTTPGGITLKGLEAMEKNGFTHAVIEGLKASK